MTASSRRFDPPAPVYGFDGTRLDRRGADAGGSVEDVEVVPARSRAGTLWLFGLAALVVVGLITAVVITSGVQVEPVAGERAPAPATSADPEGSGQLFDVPTSTNSPMTVKPGDTVPITVDAVFSQGLTLVPPKLGDWQEVTASNRPDQFSARKNGMQIVVWQTSMFDSGQSDEALSIAQLNRLSDECGGDVGGVSDPDPYMLKGKDGTNLELLRVRADDCEGASIWLLTRAMPKTGTRIYILLGSYKNIEQADELQAKLREVTFTSP